MRNCAMTVRSHFGDVGLIFSGQISKNKNKTSKAKFATIRDKFPSKTCFHKTGIVEAG